jgi:hypothetical protein
MVTRLCHRRCDAMGFEIDLWHVKLKNANHVRARIRPRWFWKLNRMRTMYVPGSETHIHNDYTVGHRHTLLKIIAENVLYYIKMSKTSTESLT